MPIWTVNIQLENALDEVFQIGCRKPSHRRKNTVFATLLEVQANLPSTFPRTAEGVHSSKSVRPLHGLAPAKYQAVERRVTS
jgi:hypothetical protein